MFSLTKNTGQSCQNSSNLSNILTAKLGWIYSDNILLEIIYNLYGNELFVRISIHVELTIFGLKSRGIATMTSLRESDMSYRWEHISVMSSRINTASHIGLTKIRLQIDEKIKLNKLYYKYVLCDTTSFGQIV